MDQDTGTAQTDGLASTLVKGTIAGVVATGALIATRDAMWALEDPAARARESEVRKDAQATPMQTAVRKAERVAGVQLSEDAERQAGLALAWGLSIAGVAAYAALRERVPAAKAGYGLGFGAAAWLLEDELMMPMLGLTPGPLEYPWQAHARGLASHLVYGVAAEATLDALDRAF